MSDEWNVQIDVSSVSAAVGGGGLDEGFYVATATEVNLVQSKAGNPRVTFKLRFDDHDGITRTGGQNMPKDGTDTTTLAYWRACLESFGYTGAELDAGPLNVGPATFMDRQCHIYYKPGDKAQGVYPTLNFLPPEEWQVRRDSFEANGGAKPAETAAPVATTLGGNKAAANTGLSASALKNMIGRK